MATARNSFESILLDKSWVSQQDLDRARQRKKPGQDLTDVLVEMGALEPQRLSRVLAQEYRLPFEAHIDEHILDMNLIRKVPINYAKKNRILPLAIHQGYSSLTINLDFDTIIEFLVHEIMCFCEGRQATRR